MVPPHRAPHRAPDPVQEHSIIQNSMRTPELFLPRSTSSVLDCSLQSVSSLQWQFLGLQWCSALIPGSLLRDLLAGLRGYWRSYRMLGIKPESAAWKVSWPHAKLLCYYSTPTVTLWKGFYSVGITYIYHTMFLANTCPHSKGKLMCMCPSTQLVTDLKDSQFQETTPISKQVGNRKCVE